MTTPERWMSEARRRADAALYIFEQGLFPEAVQCAFFAAYAAARALVVQQGSNPKTHSGLSHQLHLYYGRGSLREHLADYQDMREWRRRTHYDLDHPSQSEAEWCVRAAQSFVAAAEGLL